jgi:hypothetical protein
VLPLPLKPPGYFLGALFASVIFVLLIALLSALSARGRDSAGGALAEWLASFGPFLPWILAFVSAMAGAAIAFSWFR